MFYGVEITSGLQDWQVLQRQEGKARFAIPRTCSDGQSRKWNSLRKTTSNLYFTKIPTIPEGCFNATTAH